MASARDRLRVCVAGRGVVGLSSIWRFRGELAQAQGTVTRCEDTHDSSGRSGSRRGTPVFANYYRFERGEGVSYASGNCVDAGAPVTIEYVVADPSVSRIVGMRATTLPAFAATIIVFPLVGLLIAVGGFRDGMQKAGVMRDGKLTKGKLSSKRATTTRINNRTVFEMTFEFIDDNGRFHRAKVRTNHPEFLEDDPKENMLYEPRFPSKAVLLDALPGRLTTNESGDVLVANPFAPAAVMILPALVLVVNAIAIHFVFD